MPYVEQWVPAALALEHNNIKVYHAYKEDDATEMMGYWFMMDADGNFNENAFDVRDLPNWTEVPHPPFIVGEFNTPENQAAWKKYHEEGIEETHIDTILKEAIDLGYLDQEGITDKAHVENLDLP